MTDERQETKRSSKDWATAKSVTLLSSSETLLENYCSNFF